MSTPTKVTKEEWKSVFGFEESYEISNFGNLKSKDRFVNGKSGSKRFIKGTVQKPEVTRKGYHRYTMSIKRGESVRKLSHVLVAEHFLKKKNKNQQVNHKDGVKSNNCYKNLEWCTASENMKHAFDKGLKKPSYYQKGRVGKLSKASKPIRILNLKGEEIGVFDSMTIAHEKTGISKSIISRYLNGHVKKPRRYTYEYI